MKPKSDFAKNRFPRIDCFFRPRAGEWGGHWSPEDDPRRSFRTFDNLRREFLLECARERVREMTVFAILVLTAAWPVIYMIVSVVKLLSKGRPLDH